MKKTIIAAVAVFVAAVVFYIAYDAIFDSKCADAPERPAKVPENAEWRGCKSGNWIELVEIKRGEGAYPTDTLRIRVYEDKTGDLIIDADFSCAGHCFVTSFNQDSVLPHIEYFEGTRIYFDFFTAGHNAFYSARFPVYGGKIQERLGK